MTRIVWNVNQPYEDLIILSNQPIHKWKPFWLNTENSFILFQGYIFRYFDCTRFKGMFIIITKKCILIFLNFAKEIFVLFIVKITIANASTFFIIHRRWKIFHVNKDLGTPCLDPWDIDPGSQFGHQYTPHKCATMRIIWFIYEF